MDNEKHGDAAPHSGPSSGQPVKISRGNCLPPLQNGALRGSAPRPHYTPHKCTASTSTWEISGIVSMISRGWNALLVVTAGQGARGVNRVIAG